MAAVNVVVLTTEFDEEMQRLALKVHSEMVVANVSALSLIVDGEII